jgi:hypothetical protein
MRATCLVFVMACAQREPVFVATVAPTPPSVHGSTAPQHVMPQMTCGQTALARAELVARGKGANHPDMRAVEARLAECQDKNPSTDDCNEVMRQRIELESRGYGPQHPEIIANEAKRALCQSLMSR